MNKWRTDVANMQMGVLLNVCFCVDHGVYFEIVDQFLKMLAG